MLFEDAPGERVEIVGAVGEIVDKSEWVAAVSEEDIAPGRFEMRQGFAAQIGKSHGKVDFNARIGVGSEIYG